MTERTAPARANRAYLVRFLIAIIAYSVLLPICLVGLRSLQHSPWRYAVVLVPLLPFIAMAVAVWRYLIETDELARKIQLEALAIAFGAGAVITFGYGLLQLAGLPRISWMFVWPVYAVCWLVGGLIARRRYA